MTDARPQRMDSEAGLRPAADVVARRLGDECVLVNLRTNLIYELNRTGTRLWELLESGRGRSGLEEQMLREFDVDEDDLRGEVDALLRSLLDARLIVIDGSS